MSFWEREGSGASRIPSRCPGVTVRPRLRGHRQPGSGASRGAASHALKTTELEAPQNHPSGAGASAGPRRVGHGTQALCPWPGPPSVPAGGQERCWLSPAACCPAPAPPAMLPATPTGGIQLLRALKIGWCPCHGVGNFSRGISRWEAHRTVHLLPLAWWHPCPGLMSAPRCPVVRPCTGAVPGSTARLWPPRSWVMPGGMARAGERGQGCRGAP